MIEILSYLDERIEEFERHYSIAKMLEARVDEGTISENDNTHVDVRHINTLKSGLLIHLYNIVEAILTQTLQQVEAVISTENPMLWSEKILFENAKAEYWKIMYKNEDKSILHMKEFSVKMLARETTNPFTIKTPTGTWDDIAIKKSAKNLGCTLVISDVVRRNAYEKTYQNQKTALQYLANRRNALAHGSTTFENGSPSLTLQEIKKLSERVLPYLKEVTQSYEAYLNNKDFLKKEDEAA